MRVAVFALTGFANTVLPSLDRHGITPVIFMTRREPGPYPYYPLPNAELVSSQLGIRTSTDEADEELACGCDLLLVATYHRKVPRRIYETCRFAINLHPSLLPKYPGRNPFLAVLEAAEKETGLTAHHLTSTMDSGEYCGQWRYTIAPDETEGSLREELACLAATATGQIVQNIRNETLKQHHA